MRFGDIFAVRLAVMSADLHKFSYKKTLIYKVPNITLYLTYHPNIPNIFRTDIRRYNQPYIRGQILIS